MTFPREALLYYQTLNQTADIPLEHHLTIKIH